MVMVDIYQIEPDFSWFKIVIIIDRDDSPTPPQNKTTAQGFEEP